jgi:hypothetical protein
MYMMRGEGMADSNLYVEIRILRGSGRGAINGDSSFRLLIGDYPLTWQILNALAGSL